jgi:uncharacterized membrane protein YphA (DoxX/SURF4 family)
MIDVLERDTRNTASDGRTSHADDAVPTAAATSSSRRGEHTATIVLLPLRLFLAAGWLRAGVEKLIEPHWWDGAQLRKFLTGQREDALPFFRPVMQHLIAPAAITVAIVVMVTQIACGLAIGLGARLRLALRWGCVLNVMFILAGRVNPSAFYLVMETALLFAVADGTIGMQPSPPSKRTVVAAGVAAGMAALFVPFVRTIEPSKVIEDPAMMLSFMGVVLAVTFLLRRAATGWRHETRLTRLWTRGVAAWTCAKPRNLVPISDPRNSDRQFKGFAPPSPGTAVITAPPSTSYAVGRR